jgi:galactonate dehydratase
MHLGAAVPNWSWVETRQAPTENLGFHNEKIFPIQVDMEGPYYLVNDRPGIGVEVDEAALRASKALKYEPPHLSHPDGSVTNW